MSQLGKEWLLSAEMDIDIESRYPNEFGLLPSGKPTLDDAGEFYEFAKKIYEKAKQIVLVD
jgi:hypothetical protein